MTHGFSSSDKGKKPMNMFYDFSTGKTYAYDSNETLQEVEIGGSGGMQKNFVFELMNDCAVDINISDLSNTDTITITANYSTSYKSERVSVSTAKTYSNHIIEAQANIGAKISYSGGKLKFINHSTAYHTTVYVTFNV